MLNGEARHIAGAAVPIRGVGATRAAEGDQGMLHRGAGGLRRFARYGAAGAVSLLLANCSVSDRHGTVDPRYGVSASPRVVEPGQPVPKGGGVYRVGRPYVIAGRTYVPEENPDYRAVGLASWYGEDFHGRLTANGEVFDMEAITAAHPTMPLPSYARVTHLGNGRSIVVRINDRGPYHANRVIDLSHKSAKLLGFHGHGVARVRVEYVGPAPLAGTDDRTLLATLRNGAPAPAPSVQVASAAPFVPQSRGVPLQTGPVPVPGQRPFSLGQAEDSRFDERFSGRQVAASDLSASRLPPVMRGGVRGSGEPAPAEPTRRLSPSLTFPVSAYAPFS
jgi:rare lipoprotein A